MLPPNRQSLEAELQGQLMSGLALAIWRQHRARKLTRPNPAWYPGAIPQGDIVAFSAQHERLPEADNAGAKNVDFYHVRDLAEIQEKSKQASLWGCYRSLSGAKGTIPPVGG
jgi:hypothetical protein